MIATVQFIRAIMEEIFQTCSHLAIKCKAIKQTLNKLKECFYFHLRFHTFMLDGSKRLMGLKSCTPLIVRLPLVWSIQMGHMDMAGGLPLLIETEEPDSYVGFLFPSVTNNRLYGFYKTHKNSKNFTSILCSSYICI